MSKDDIMINFSDLAAYGIQPKYPMELMLEHRDMLQALDSAKAIRDFYQKIYLDVV